MSQSIAYLGPAGTYSEAAALAYVNQLSENVAADYSFHPYPTIAQTLRAVADGEVSRAVVPVENSIEGSVAISLDSIWQLERLQIQQALVLPIAHALLARTQERQRITTVYSHPQALGQCQQWLQNSLPHVKLMATNSTTEAVTQLDRDELGAAIASMRAAELYQVPVLAYPIGDRRDNCTRFWVVSLESAVRGTHISLAFSLPKNSPGALVKPLQVFAERGINMSRIESRPTKRSLGEYLFFIDIEADADDSLVDSALDELKKYTETLKIFGRYPVQLIKH